MEWRVGKGRRRSNLRSERLRTLPIIPILCSVYALPIAERRERGEGERERPMTFGSEIVFRLSSLAFGSERT